MVDSESLGLGMPHSIVSNSGVTRTTPIESKTTISGVGVSASLSSGFLEKSLFVQRNQDETPNNLVAGFHLHESSELVWHGKAAQVEEGWITVEGKKDKSSKPSFDMILRFHKKSVKCKS